MKFCKDCRFYIAGTHRCLDQCDKNASVDYVRGEEPRREDCAMSRASSITCGPDAKWFEPRLEHQQAAE